MRGVGGGGVVNTGLPDDGSHSFIVTWKVARYSSYACLPVWTSKTGNYDRLSEGNREETKGRKDAIVVIMEI